MVRIFSEKIKQIPIVHKLLFVALLTVVSFTYSNHFDNGFHFDDAHTVVNNIYIRNIANIPLFFTDIDTYSGVPQNHIYRPLVTTSLAIDYWIGGGLNPFYFHLSMFVTFLLQGILMFLLYRMIIQKMNNVFSPVLIAFCMVTWYMLHPVNAETINYILARSDLLSTFFVVLGVYMYARGGKTRTYFIYLIPLILGLLTKRTAAMMVPILISYILLFEIDKPIHKAIPGLLDSANRNPLIHISALTLLTIVGYLFTAKMTQTNFSFSLTSNYLITQPYVVLHYFKMFFIPDALSADTDWTHFSSISDPRAIKGILFVFLLFCVGAVSAFFRKLKPVCFGIFWFLFALIPTSSFIPLAEVMNDHRMYYPFVGLILAVGWVIYLIIEKLQSIVGKKEFLNGALTMIFLLVMSAYAYATYQRNEVWDNDKSLWHDVTIKSPNNARGLMNYGVELMAEGDLKGALDYFKRAEKLITNYPYLYINMAIVEDALGNKDQAEKNYKRALQVMPGLPASHHYFAKYLIKYNRKEEARTHLERALSLAPADMEVRHLLMNLLDEQKDSKALQMLINETLDIDAKDEVANRIKNQLTGNNIDKEFKEVNLDQLLKLSMQAFYKRDYEGCIAICQRIVEQYPNNAEAYYNMCTAYNILQDFKKADEACNEVLRIDPNFELNLNKTPN